MLPFVYVVLGSTLFILVAFPFFFRTSLIKPLEALLRGVQRVNTGDLAARVPVRVNDEIGILAQNFNRMTTSLKAAEEQLRAYAEGLEEKVAERTADLQQALHHLTQTQDQLIHAEKMASLGQLTWRNGIYPGLGVATTALVAAHSAVDFSLQIPAVGVTYAFILGIACAQSFPSES